MKCADCRWFHKENEICLKTGNSIFGIYIDNKCEYVNNMTVFEKITASPEVLAEVLVFTSYFEDCHYQKRAWKSVFFLPKRYKTKEEAIAETVAKLKEVQK